MKDPLQTIIRVVEVGEAQFLVRLIPLLVSFVVIGGVCNFMLFRGLDDAQSMDNAQLARQIVRGEGYTTKFLRPQALADLRAHVASKSLGMGNSADLFPPDQFPKGTPKILPDTYNAPGYPYLLAAWFYLVKPQFDEAVSPALEGFVASSGKLTHVYSGDRWIPPLNLVFLMLTGILIYFMGRRLFDDRVAWLCVVSFYATDMVWQYSLTGLSTSFLTFLVTGVIYCTLEIFCVAEECFEGEDKSFTMAWLWAIPLCLLLAATCLTRLPLLVLLVPLLVLFCLMPRPSWPMAALIGVFVLASVIPWFWHIYKVSGTPLGSNASYLLYGLEGYKGDQVFCGTTATKYDSLLRNLSQKETSGFIWHLQHGWQLLGSNPLILLFLASLTHAYKRRRAQMLQWFLAAAALILIAANNVGFAEPEVVGPWNILTLLFPSMLVVGSAFFFIQLDRLNLQVWLLNNLIVMFLLILTALPLAVTLTTESQVIYAFPPYMPPLIKVVGQYSDPDEWVTTDMPWASAWYSDRASLWLPDSISDFQNLYDNVCPTGILYFTPVTWTKPASNLTTGEDKDWFPLMTQLRLPDGYVFPLQVRTGTPPGGPEYVIWSNRPRWQTR
jgi:hypothetical protein